MVNGLYSTWRWVTSGVPQGLSWDESCSALLPSDAAEKMKSMHVRFAEDTKLVVRVWKTAGRKGLIGPHEIQHGQRPSPTLGRQSPAGMQAGAGGAREHL